MLLPRVLLSSLERFGSTKNVQDVSSVANTLCESEGEKLESELSMIRYIAWAIPSVGFIITWSFVGILYFIINIYYYAIIASIIMSFVMLFSGNMNPHPILQLIWQLTEPVMGPVRKVIPPMGGLDFSPIFIFIAIRLIQNMLIQSFNINQQIATVVIGI